VNTPAARRTDIIDVLHGVAVPDPYRWLEDGDAPEVQEWVEANNSRTREALDARPRRSQWHERLVALMQLPVTGGGSQRADRLFVVERPAGAEQLQLVLRSASDPRVAPRVLIDPANLSSDGTTALDWSYASPDGALVAYGVSEGGSERSTLRILVVDTGEHLADEIPEARAASLSWLPDSSGFYYTRFPPDDEYHRWVYFHILGTDPATDELVWGADAPQETWPDVSVSSDGRHVLVHAMHGWSQIDVHLLDRETARWSEVVSGTTSTSRFRFHGDQLVGVTSLGAPKSRIVTTPMHECGVEYWRTLIAEGESVRGDFALVGLEIVSMASERGIDRLERHHVDTGEFIEVIPGLGLVSLTSPFADRSDDADTAFFSVTGFDSPSTLWKWKAATGARPWVLKADGAPQLTTSYRTFPSLDGTPVGTFLVHRSDVVPGPETPALINGYGGFAITESPAYSPMVAAWCEAGGLFALVGLRGGYEEGEAWHHAGRRATKQNVFDDFHAAAEWLLVEGMTSQQHLGIYGGSNGGLLVGVALTQRPELYRAVWCAVPLLDMIRYPQFLIARLWTDEYGDPDIAEEFAWLHAYSPYHHVVEGREYPSVLLTTAEGDSRVDPLHARKMAALLQHAAAAQDERPILLTQESRAGHGAGKPVSKRADEAADVLSFFAWQLDVEDGLR
jgi:prolyl oligopeptidase